MAFSNGLRTMSLATLVAVIVLGTQSVPMATADGSPSVTADASPSVDPAPSASPTPSPSASPSPSADPTPSLSASPSPSADPTASPSDPPPSPTPSPSTSPDPAAPAPTPTPEPDQSGTISPAVARARRARARRVRIVRIARRQLGDRYVRGATGPNAFDCSGLVRFAYRRAHVSRFLGGGHSARLMLLWGRRHHLTGRHHPRIGDVVIYGNGSHAAIYLGHGRVISALNPRQGIRITRLHALNARFTTFIHTRL